jgi:ubiquinone/menaquinone biosynthesis C-methylase UbiE
MPARYDEVAASYAAGPDDYSHPALAALLELAEPVSGAQALDLACGHGLVARELARRGARVLGLDLSEQLLQRARSIEADTNLGIEFVHGDAADPTVLDAASFDLVVCNFGLSDIDDLEGVCATVARVLTGGGRFVFSILHPCFAGAAQVNASWPPNGTYYDEGWWRADRELSTLRQQVGSNHRMLSTYVNALARHGIPFETLVEPPPESSWTTERPSAASLPVYFVARCRRPPSV